MRWTKWIAVIAIFTLFGFCVNVFASDVKISDEIVRQGGLFFVTIENAEPIRYRIGFLEKQYLSLPILGYEKTQFAVIPVSVNAPVGTASIFVESDLEFAVPKEIEIEKTNFPVLEGIVINKPLKSSELKRYEKERKILDAIYLRNTKYPFFDERHFIFNFPLNGTPTVSSQFGTTRKTKTGSKGKVQTVSHSGTDYAVPAGTEVFAVETGIVRFTGDLLLSGKTIIVDHGFGIFSAYLHLSDIEIKEGDIVLRGELVARSGATGRVRGAHLHFGIRVHDSWVDPDEFLPEKEKQ